MSSSSVLRPPRLALACLLFTFFFPALLFAANGDKEWEFATPAPIFSSPAIGFNSTIYVGSFDTKLYAIAPDGTKEWEFATGGQILSSPAISLNGTIYVGSVDTKLYAVAPDGTKEWEFAAGEGIFSSPAISLNGTIYVGSKDDKLYAVAPDGTKEWEFLTGDDIFSSPAISLNGTIYVGSLDDKLYAIAPDGTKEWEFAAGNSINYPSPAISLNGTVYVGSLDNKLYAVAPDGTKEWEFATGNDISSSPAISINGTVYVGSNDNKLYAVAPDGTKEWEFATGNSINISSPAISSNGTVYVGSDDNKLYAVAPDGTKEWEFATGGQILSSPVISSNGTVYVGSQDTKLYALESHAGGLANSAWPMFKRNALRTSRYSDENTSVLTGPGQSINITIRDSSSCAKTAAELSAAYGTQADLSPLAEIKGFNATLSRKNANATFRFNATGLSDAVSQWGLYKLFDANGTNLSFKAYSKAADNRTDGAWWMTNVNGTYLDQASVLDENAIYYFAFTIKDNGDYDANATLGEIRDPTVPVKAGGAGAGAVISDDDLGCVFNPNAGFSFDLIFLILAALVLPCARRRG